MKNKLALAILFLLPFVHHAQIADSTTWDSEWTVHQSDWADENNGWEKVDLQQKDLTRLLEIPGVTELYLAKIEEYRKVNNGFLHIHELYQIPDIPTEIIDLILPLVYVSQLIHRTPAKNQISIRSKKTNTSQYERFRIKYQPHPNCLIGLQGQLPKADSPSFYSGYGVLQHNHHQLYLGDFIPLLGQGNLFDQNLQPNGWTTERQIKNTFRIKPYTSSISNFLWRGIGYCGQYKKWKTICVLPIRNQSKSLLAIQYAFPKTQWSFGILKQHSLTSWMQGIWAQNQNIWVGELCQNQRHVRYKLATQQAIGLRTKCAAWMNGGKNVVGDSAQWKSRCILEWSLSSKQMLILGVEQQRMAAKQDYLLPSIKNIFCFHYQFSPIRYAQFYARYLVQSSNNLEISNYRNSIQSMRLDGHWKADENWTLHFRAEQKYQNRQMSRLIFQDLEWHPMGRAWKFIGRYAVFQCPNWDGRIYAMERETTGGFYIPAYYGSGYRCYGLIQWKSNFVQLQTKVGLWMKHESTLTLGQKLDIQIQAAFSFR
jgi:hypothetical protein